MTSKPISTHAAAAAAIRRDLKAAFPSVKFSVRSESFSGGNSVDIGWTDGPTTEAVNSLSGKYQYGHFDGMIDLYEYSNRRDDIPQAKFIQTQRRTSREAFAAAVELVNRRFGWSLAIHPEWNCVDETTNAPIPNGNGWQSHEVNSTLYRMSLLCPECSAATLPGDNFCPKCGTKFEQGEASMASPVHRWTAPAWPALALLPVSDGEHDPEPEPDPPATAPGNTSASDSADETGIYLVTIKQDGRTLDRRKVHGSATFAQRRAEGARTRVAVRDGIDLDRIEAAIKAITPPVGSMSDLAIALDPRSLPPVSGGSHEADDAPCAHDWNRARIGSGDIACTLCGAPYEPEEEDAGDLDPKAAAILADWRSAPTFRPYIHLMPR